MGILDFLTGNNAAASPWGALYQSPLSGMSPQDLATLNAAAVGGMGINPASVQPDPFGSPSSFSVADPSKPPQPAPATGFGAGASPFGFAGPGSMTGISPAAFAAPAGPQPGPAPAPAPAPIAAAPAPASDLSSVNRSPVAPAAPAADDSEDSPAPVRPPVAPVITGQPSPFSLAGAGLGDRLMKGTRGFLGNLGNGPIGALAGGLGALVTGQSTDPASIASEQNSLTAQALLKKGASQAEVQAARYNPTLQKALIDQYYGKDKWSVVQVGEDNGTKIYKQQNQVDGTLRDIPGVAAPSGAGDFVTGPDGKQIPIPPGANRKEFIKRVTEATADAATGKKTEAQAKASSFAARMTQAEGVLGGLQNEGLSLGNTVAGKIPVAGNYLQSTDYQRYKQASSAFITAMLRQESGAAINKSEFDRYEKEMFPQPGDDASVVQQKAAMRAAAIEQMKGAAGPGFKGPAPGGTVNVGGAAINWSVK